MRFDITKIMCVAVLMPVLLSVSSASAQEVRKTLNDLFVNPLRHYQPDDPDTRSAAFNKQTGHSGLFYNCDGEEQKRYSPYIYWSNQTNCPLPRHKSFIENVRYDLNQVAQRIADGSCKCGSFGCGGSCDEKSSHQPGCACYDCAAKSNSVSATVSPFIWKRSNRPPADVRLQSVQTEGLMSRHESSDATQPARRGPTQASVAERIARYSKQLKSNNKPYYQDRRTATVNRSGLIPRSLVQSGAQILSQKSGKYSGSDRRSSHVSTGSCGCVECRVGRANARMAIRPSSQRKR